MRNTTSKWNTNITPKGEDLTPVGGWLTQEHRDFQWQRPELWLVDHHHRPQERTPGRQERQDGDRREHRFGHRRHDVEVGRTRRDNPVVALTPRRLEVLALVAQGHSNTRIARELVITEKAIERNIAFIFDSLGLPPEPDNHRRVLAVVRYLNRDV
jgi:ATP/maltotriose-dependent transcriptional regulator MalT